MFGCLVAGRLLQTNLQQIDETHALFELANASTINHICVFLLGTSESTASRRIV
jgi:protein Hikeshi